MNSNSDCKRDKYTARELLSRSIYMEFRLKYKKLLTPSAQTEEEKKNIMSSLREVVETIVRQLSDKEVNYYIDNIDDRKKLANRIRDYALLSLGSENKVLATTLLIKLYSGFIRKVALHTYLDYEISLNSNSFEEVVTDVISKLWTIRNTYNPIKGTFSTWLAAIIRNNIRHNQLVRNRVSLISLDKNSNDSDFDDFENYIYQIESQKLFTSPDVIFAIEYYAESVFIEIFKEPVSYPWQMICFLLKIIGYRPKSIVDQFSDLTLSQITKSLKTDFKIISRFENAFIDKSFEPFESNLEIKLSSENSPTFYYKNLKLFIGKRTGDIELNNFFGKSPSKSVSEWALKVSHKLSLKFAE